MMDSHTQESLAERVGAAVLEKYCKSIGRSRSKGQQQSKGALEWTILSGICLVFEDAGDAASARIEPIALGTGTKALPYTQVREGCGDLLHDCHAEVMTRRAARRWLCQRLIAEEASRRSAAPDVDGLPYLFVFTANLNCRNSVRRRLRDKVRIWWYISTLPCGECSTPSLERRRQAEDSLASRSIAVDGSSVEVNPRSQIATFIRTGVIRGRVSSRDTTLLPTLRTVPGRADSPPALSHSCTDKLLLWSIVGWQGASLCRWIEPIGIDSIVVADGAPESEHRALVQSEVFCGLDVRRRSGAEDSPWPLNVNHAGTLCPPRVHVVAQTFSESLERTLVSAKSLNLDRDQVIPAWSSHSWMRPTVQPETETSDGNGAPSTAGWSKEVETVVNGVKQGAPQRRPKNCNGKRRPLSDKARSRLCKVEHMRLLARVESALAEDSSSNTRSTLSYAALKGKSSRDVYPGVAEYRLRKDTLRDHSLVAGAELQRIERWLAALGRSESPADSVKASSSISAATKAPLSGWLITPPMLEHFDSDGSLPIK